MNHLASSLLVPCLPVLDSWREGQALGNEKTIEFDSIDLAFIPGSSPCCTSEKLLHNSDPHLTPSVK